VKDWSIEFYEDEAGKRPVKSWMDSLSDIKREAAIAAIQIILKRQGVELSNTKWMKPLGGSLFEFRIRHTGPQISRMYGLSGYEGRNLKLGLVLRIFLAFEGERVIILLGAYDKGRKDSARNQQKQIEISRKRLTERKERS